MSGDRATPTPTPPLPDADVFPLLFQAYPDALLLVDAAGLIVLGNPAAAATRRRSTARSTCRSDGCAGRWRSTPSGRS